jgi:hypothetical protein
MLLWSIFQPVTAVRLAEILRLTLRHPLDGFPTARAHRSGSRHCDPVGVL